LLSHVFELRENLTRLRSSISQRTRYRKIDLEGSPIPAEKRQISGPTRAKERSDPSRARYMGQRDSNKILLISDP
jgi:hypothetical protein